MTIDDYFNALDEGIEPIVPYIFRIPKGKTFVFPTYDVQLILFRRIASA